MTKLAKLFRRHYAQSGPAPAIDTSAVEPGEPVSEPMLRRLFQYCADVHIQAGDNGDSANPMPLVIVFCEGLTNLDSITDQMLAYIREQMRLEADETAPSFGSRITNAHTLRLKRLAPDTGPHLLVDLVFSGSMLLHFPLEGRTFTVDIASVPQRGPEDSNAENSIRGSRDGFIEELDINVALIRKRLATNSLCYERFTLGRRSRTQVGLLYMNDLASPKTIDMCRKRLQEIDVEAISNNAQLEELLTGDQLTLFPLTDYTGRPDYAGYALMQGRFILLVNGSPTATIAPANIMLLFSSPGDAYSSVLFATFTRLLRIFALLLSLFLPGFYIALCVFNPDQLPLPLLATISVARTGTPLSAPFELFLMIILLELFREAGLQLPKPIGSTITVVGGLIIGDAAIRAGLISPSIIVVAAASVVASSTLVNQNLIGSITVIRMGVFLFSSTLGMFGFLLAILLLTLHLVQLESFGLPYMTPLSPLDVKQLPFSLLRLPWRLKTKALQPWLKEQTQEAAVEKNNHDPSEA
ncbi:MAG: spore germination protein [Paenibacillaceae bacterium]|nr:spore germination protein [Paenibacillaceae bacterium]